MVGELPSSKMGDSDAAGDDIFSLAMLCHWVREQLELRVGNLNYSILICKFRVPASFLGDATPRISHDAFMIR